MANVVLRAFSAGALLLRRSAPPLTTQVSERPEACLLARRQAALGTRLTNRLHQTVDVADPAVRRFVQLLDATRTIDHLVADREREASDILPAGEMPPEISREAVARNLAWVLRLALLVS